MANLVQAKGYIWSLPTDDSMDHISAGRKTIWLGQEEKRRYRRKGLNSLCEIDIKDPFRIKRERKTFIIGRVNDAFSYITAHMG